MVVKTIREFLGLLRETTRQKYAIGLPVKSREVHVSCYPDMWWGHATILLEWSLENF